MARQPQQQGAGSLTGLQTHTLDYLVFDEFETMDTQTARQAMQPNRLAWLENLQPISKNFLLCVPGLNTPLDTGLSPTTFKMFYAYINSTNYICVFGLDGSLNVYNALTGAATNVAAAGTFSTSAPGPDLTTWKSEAILIADPTAGYCAWDGSNFAKEGTLSMNVNVVLDGLGYTSNPTVTIVDLAGFGTAATATSTEVSGMVTTVTVTNVGHGFTAQSVPVLRFSGGGTAGGGVTAAPILNGGSGYTSVPSVTFAAPLGGGTTAIGTATIANGEVTGITITTAGSGYKENPAVTIGAPNVAGGAQAYANAQVENVAYATCQAWPFFSITPNTLAVFQGRVWLGGGRTLQWSGTGGFDDASVSDAAGFTQIPDSDLIQSIYALRSLNNYLYIFGDNSIKQIGTIQVSSGSTLFTIVTLASDLGTTFPQSITSYNRLVLFANKVGVHAIFGASVQKISDPMDGVYRNLNFTQQLCAAVNDVNSIHCYLLLARYNDPVLGNQRSIMLTFMNNKWFIVSTSLSSAVVAMCSAPIAGTYETFVSSGNDITQILESPSTAVPIILRTAMSHHGKKFMEKKVLRYAIAHQAQSIGQVNGSIDTENGSQTFTYQFAVQVTWVNAAGQPVQFVNSSNAAVNFVGVGFLFERGQAAGSGVYIGMSLSGTFSGFAINSLFIEYQDRTVLVSRPGA